MRYSNQLPMSDSAGPVQRSERFVSLDVLRGVAVLGILVMNIYAFAMPFAAYFNPLAAGGTEPHNIGTWFFTHVLFDQKFMSIFSMLFGAGIVLMAERAAARGAKFGRIFYRRQFWLLVLGLAHAYFIWFGDILFFYAVVGMLMYLFRNLSPRALIATACAFLPVAVLLSSAGGVYMQDLQSRAADYEQRQELGETLSEEELAAIEEWTESRPMLMPGADEIHADTVAFTGSYADAFNHRREFLNGFLLQGLLFFIIWRVGGLMLLGMALMKLGVLSAARSTAFYKRMMLIAYGIGLPVCAFSAWSLNAHEFNGLWAFRIGNISNYIGSILVALGHIALVMWIVRKGLLAALMQRFAAVGQMALTNYLMHSVVMTTIFYGHGLGLYGAIPRFWQMAFVAGLIGFQLILSPWWLARWRFGPVEWLWRSLTYWQRQPMRRTA